MNLAPLGALMALAYLGFFVFLVTSIVRVTRSLDGINERLSEIRDVLERDRARI